MNYHIAVIPGDGIGPEIVLKTLAEQEIVDIAKCVVVGDAKVLKNAMTFPGIPRLEIKVIDQPEEGGLLRRDAEPHRPG